MAWYDDFQFINKHTMFLLQLHPIYRSFYAVVYGIWGILLLYFGSKHAGNKCAKDVAALEVVIGSALCLGALSFIIGLGTRKHRFQGDELFPYPKILIVDWILTAFTGFFCFGMLNFWYWGFITEDHKCPQELKNVTLGYLIYCYVQLTLLCYSVLFVAFKVSGPSYIYQEVVYDIDPPDCLLTKFSRKELHNYGSTVSLNVPDYPEPRLSGMAAEMQRREQPGGLYPSESGAQLYQGVPEGSRSSPLHDRMIDI